MMDTRDPGPTLAAEARPPQNLAGDLRRLVGALDDADKAFLELRDHLDPIRRNNPAPEDGGNAVGEDTPTRSYIGDELANYTARIRDLTARIVALSSDLDL